MSLREMLFDDGMRGWIFQQARKEFWRVSSWYELDDLVQDGFLAFAKCWHAYGAKLEGDDTQTLTEKRKWMMALVMTSFTRHIHDLATDKTATPEMAESQLSASELTGAQNRFTYVAEMELNLKLRDAPAEIQNVVTAFANDSAAAFKYVKTRVRREIVKGTVRVRRTRRTKVLRESTNEFLCRLAGVPRDSDMRTELQEYFSS